MLGRFDESSDELFEKIAIVVPCLPEKDSSFLRWRYGPSSPQTLASVLGVRSGKELLGYAVFRVSENQNAYILDPTTFPGRHDLARALLRGALRFFRRARPPSIRYRFLESSTSPRTKDLWRLGFFFTRKRKCSLLVKFSDRSLHGTANGTARWSYSFGDGEPPFWGV